MQHYAGSRLIDLIQQKVSGGGLLSGQRDFIADHIATPLFKEIKSTEVYYFTIQKQTLSILVSQPIKSEESKRYLDLFANDCSDYWFVTDQGIVSFNVLSFLEEGTFTLWLYDDLDSICVGRQYGSIDIEKNNPPVVGIFSKDGAYNWAFITEEDIPILIDIFEHFPKTASLFHKLSDDGLLSFLKKRKKSGKIKP